MMPIVPIYFLLILPQPLSFGRFGDSPPQDAAPGLASYPDMGIDVTIDFVKVRA